MVNMKEADANPTSMVLNDCLFSRVYVQLEGEEK